MAAKAKAPALIPAVGYLRKSTKGERTDGNGRKRERQEKSLSQQKAEIIKLAAGRYHILKWFEDEGISGWKRGAKRPDFQRMLAEVKGLGAQAIVCDNLDRFSRATVDEVQIDAAELRHAGVRWIVTASHGDYDLGKRHDIGEILKFVVAVWSGNEYSRQLGRRVSLARRNRALEGKRTGGTPPYALDDDGSGGLKPGDPKKVKIVRWIFDQFANHARSINWIAGELNLRKTPGPTGNHWAPRTVALVLRQSAYRGDFTFNKNPSGQFFRIDAKREVVERADLSEKGYVFKQAGVYKPIIAPALFDKAQRRLEIIKVHRNRRKAGYALSGGLLVCDHCDSGLVGTPVHDHTVYRCPSHTRKGTNAACPQWGIREDQILPFILQTMSEQMADLRLLLTNPPKEFASPGKAKRSERESLQTERDALAGRIERWRIALLDLSDKEDRKKTDREIAVMRAQLSELDAKLAETPQPEGFIDEKTGRFVRGYSKDEVEAMANWWDKFYAEAVAVPVVRNCDHPLRPRPPEEDPEDSDYAGPHVMLDARKVNETLHQLGTEVRLRWATQESTVASGATHRRHVVTRGRFKLGQQNGKLPRYVLATPACRPATTGR